MAHCCFNQGCERKAEYICQCWFSVAYACEFHLQLHLKLPNRTHCLDSVITVPSELTKEVTLKFLAKEKAKKKKLKDIALASCSKNSENAENSNEINLNDINSDLEEISCLIDKISKLPDEEPLLNSLESMPDADLREAISLNRSDEYAKVTLFCQLCQLRNKRSEILSKANNDKEREQDFRKTCKLYENHASNSSTSEAYQDLIKVYQKFTSTHLISKKANLYIYNTETEKEEVKALDPKLEIKPLRYLTQLPNGELFFLSSNPSYAFILDKNYQIRKLPLGVPNHCFGAIYFNRSVYCFGGNNENSSSRKFNLDENRWTEFAKIEKDIGQYFNSVIFNRNILISIDGNSEILLYSIDIDSFSEIPYSFAQAIKILISAEERLYLIERYSNGYIYESEDEYNWKPIAKPIIEDYLEQLYCSYNKGGIYISTIYRQSRAYYKFDINQNKLIDIAFYSEKLGLRRSGNKLKAIKNYKNTFKLDPDHAEIYIDKGYTLYHIVRKLEELEENNREIYRYRDTKDSDFYELAWNMKGSSLLNLGRNLEAIECYNEAIRTSLDRLGKNLETIEYKIEAGKIEGYLATAYINKGITLDKLNRNLEAIEYFNKAIKLEPDNGNIYFHKGNAFEKESRHLEAIECYKTAINLNNHWAELYNNIGISFQNLDRNLEAIEYYNFAIAYEYNYVDSHNNKGNALLKLERYAEAIECYNEAIKLVPYYADYYINKGDALSHLQEDLEAIVCYNEAIRFKPDDARAYNNKGNSLVKIGRNIEAIECFNEAIKFKPDLANAYNSKGEALYNLERNVEAIECYNEAIKLKIDEPMFYRNRANAFSKLGRQIEALQDFNKADDLVKNQQA